MKRARLSDEERSIIYGLIETMVKNLEEEYRLESDPFERYSKRVKLHLFKQIKHCPERFIRGHQAIREELDG